MHSSFDDLFILPPPPLLSLSLQHLCRYVSVCALKTGALHNQVGAGEQVDADREMGVA